MGMHIEGNKVVIITEPNTIHFDLHEDVGKNLKHKIHEDFLARHRTKNEISR